MSKKLFSPELSKPWMASICLIATDMDGTMTREGKFDHRLIQRLEMLQAHGIPVVIVTGRSAGWVSGLVEYLPITGAIAENGGYLYTAQNPHGESLVARGADFRQSLAQVFQRLQQHYPTLVPSADNQFRITDWTFDRNDLGLNELKSMTTQCQHIGWDFTYSSIQCHIKLPQQSKQNGLLKALEFLDYPLAPDQILTLGDSPNDAELLDHHVFPYSVGVGNITPYLDAMSTHPQWVSGKDELEGFLEVTGARLALEQDQ